MRWTGAPRLTPCAGSPPPCRRPRSLRGLAAQLQGEADGVRQAALVQQAFGTATAMLRQVQEARLPAAGGQVDLLNRAAGQLDARRPLAEQRAAVQHVFDMAGSVLERVAVAGRG
jgi:hypothetical protein